MLALVALLVLRGVSTIQIRCWGYISYLLLYKDILIHSTQEHFRLTAMSCSKKPPRPTCLSSGPLPSLPQFGGPHNRQSRRKRRQLQFSLFLQSLSGGNSLGVCLDYVIPSNGHNCCDMRDQLCKHQNSVLVSYIHNKHI